MFDDNVLVVPFYNMTNLADPTKVFVRRSENTLSLYTMETWFSKHKDCLIEARYINNKNVCTHTHVSSSALIEQEVRATLAAINGERTPFTAIAVVPIKLSIIKLAALDDAENPFTLLVK